MAELHVRKLRFILIPADADAKNHLRISYPSSLSPSKPILLGVQCPVGRFFRFRQVRAWAILLSLCSCRRVPCAIGRCLHLVAICNAKCPKCKMQAACSGRCAVCGVRPATPATPNEAKRHHSGIRHSPQQHIPQPIWYLGTSIKTTYFV